MLQKCVVYSQLQVDSYRLTGWQVDTEANSQYIEFDKTISACIIAPERCINGGSVAFWVKITDCSQDEGIMSSYTDIFTGFVMRC